MAKTFAQLKTLVGTYLDRSDLTSVVGDWVNSAIRKIERQENFNGMMNRATTTSSVEFLSVPTGFKEVISFKVKDTSNLYYDVEKKDIGDMLLLNQDEQMMPMYYCYIPSQSEFQLRPIPNTTYTFDITYYKYSTELSADGDTNWWTNNAWETVLYGALLEAEPYLMNDARLTVWKGLLDDYLNRIRQSEIPERYKLLAVKPSVTTVV